MRWRILLTLLRGKSIDAELCDMLDYVIEENLTYRRAHGPLRHLTNNERLRLSLLARKIARKNFDSICTIFKPETVIGWYRKILRESHTYKAVRSKGGRPSTHKEIEAKLVQIATENRFWGYGKLQGALKNAGHTVSKSTIKRILERNGIPPMKDRQKQSRWSEFIKANMDVLWAGDFAAVDVLTTFGVKTKYILFFIHYKTRHVHIGGITENPTGSWMRNVARQLVDCENGPLIGSKYLILDNDGTFQDGGFRSIIGSSGIEFVKIPVRSPDLNAYAERWIRSLREECLNHLILLRSRSLDYAVNQYVIHYNRERNHQGIGNRLVSSSHKRQAVRLGGLLRYYGRDAA